MRAVRRWAAMAALCVAGVAATQGVAAAAPAGESVAVQRADTPVFMGHFPTYFECFGRMTQYNLMGFMAYCAIWPDGVQADLYVFLG